MLTPRTFVPLVAAAITLAAASLVIAADAAPTAPPAVLKTANSLAGADNKTIELSVTKDDGKTVYDLEFVLKGTNYAADIDPQGNILAREVEVDPTVVPPAVVEAAAKSHADGKVAEYAIVTRGNVIYYGVDVKVGNDIHELDIQPNGSIIKDTVDAPETSIDLPGAAPKTAGPEKPD